MKTRFVLPFLLVVLTAAGRGEEAVDPQPLIKEVVAAVGGPDKLLRHFRMKEKYHFGSEPETKSPSSRESILDAPGYWWVGKKDRTDEPAKFDVWAWTLCALTDPKSKIGAAPEVSEDGKPAVGLRISESITPPLELYFDKETKLLVRMDWRNDIYRFSDWREHDGVKYAAKTIIFRKTTGKPWFYHEITEIERLKEVPAELPR